MFWNDRQRRNVFLANKQRTTKAGKRKQIITGLEIFIYIIAYKVSRKRSWSSRFLKKKKINSLRHRAYRAMMLFCVSFFADKNGVWSKRDQKRCCDRQYVARVVWWLHPSLTLLADPKTGSQWISRATDEEPMLESMDFFSFLFAYVIERRRQLLLKFRILRSVVGYLVYKFRPSGYLTFVPWNYIILLSTIRRYRARHC